MKRCASVGNAGSGDADGSRRNQIISAAAWHTASAAFDVAEPERSAGLEDCGKSPCLACARQAIFERASEWQGRRSPE